METFFNTIDRTSSASRLKKADYMEIMRGILLILFGVMMLVQIGNMLSNRALAEMAQKLEEANIRYENVR